MAASKKAILAKFMKRRYPMLVQQDETGSWFAAFPDLPGCMSQGASPTLAVKSAEQARACWMEVALDDGQSMPEPSDSVDLLQVLKKHLKDKP